MSGVEFNGLIQVGLKIKALRNSRGLTLEETAKRSNLSKGLLSKVENFRTIPSLQVLCAIAKALDVGMAEMVSGVDAAARSANYILTRADSRTRVDREDAKGFIYELLGTRNAEVQTIQAFVLTLFADSRRKKQSTDGEQFIYILDGEIAFHYGRERLMLTAGDALLFDGRVPHLPKCHDCARSTLLSMYFIKEKTLRQ